MFIISCAIPLIWKVLHSPLLPGILHMVIWYITHGYLVYYTWLPGMLQMVTWYIICDYLVYYVW